MISHRGHVADPAPPDGYSTDVTLEYIVEAAGIGTGTIYRRFASIEDLVGVVLEEKMRRFVLQGS